MIEFRDVTFAYGEASTPSVEHISLQVQPGETVVLCGASGCGKSTMTRLINGLIPAFHEGTLTGEVLLDGRPVDRMKLHEVAEHVGSVFQNPRTQFYNVEATAELAFGCENLGIDPYEIERRIRQTADRFSLHDLLDRNLFTMSGGEKQRIACGSVDATAPPVMVLDEPSSNLDLPAIADLTDYLEHWRADGKTLVIAEHRIFYLLGLADRFIYLKDGQIVHEFTSAEVRALAPHELEELGLRSPDPWALEPQAQSRGTGETLQLRSLVCSSKAQRRLFIPELTLPRGEVIAVVGRNGAGKSTLARALCALDRSCRGEIVLDGISYDHRHRRDLVYMVMQDVNHQLFTEDVISELRLSMDGVDPDGDQTRAVKILQSLDLMDKADRHPMSLSGGEKQRVAIGSAIAARREILILDEPTSGLDYRRMVEVAQSLQAVSAEGTTVFILTHDIELVLRCCTHVIHLEAGEVAHCMRVTPDQVQRLHTLLT